MNSEEIQFWEDLSISAEDVLELIKTSKRPIVKLENRLKKYSGWLIVLNEFYNKKYKTLKLFLNYLFKNKKTEFKRLFFLVIFASAVDHHSIMKRIPDNLSQKYEKDLQKKNISYEAILFPIFKNNSKTLIDIFYDTFINRSSFKNFKTKKEIDAENFLTTLTKEQIKKFFEGLNKKNIIRRNVRVWWFEPGTEKTKILVRLESKKRNAIPQVSQNIFLKTAGHRAILLSDKGNKLEVLARESISTAKWTSILLSKALKKNIDFELVVQAFETEKFNDFVNKIKLNQIPKIVLIGLERKNVPIINSPIIRMNSKNMRSLKESLDELENSHNLKLMSQMKDIIGITVAIDGVPFRISTMSNDNGKTIVGFDNKNLPEELKNKVIQMISDEM